ncbi:MAG: cellulose biosynthesis cyclic di-GMP-binding regulatory protein BcsB [Leptolinea sp.]|jgi:hypothetical protein|nr:cellulose biosynthesis cyclic di-GMP-binding regulatory protein BcsB [Leptolinea sp.]
MDVKNYHAYRKLFTLAFVLLFLFQAGFGAGYPDQPVTAPTVKPTQTSTLPRPLPTKSPTVTPKPTSTPKVQTGPLPTPFPTLSDYNTYVNSAKIHLSQLGYLEQLIKFPNSAEIYAKLPDQWQLKATSSFTIHYTLMDEVTSVTRSTSNRDILIPSLEVYINDMLAASFIPMEGKDQYYTFDIPIAIINREDNKQNSYTFSFEFVDDRDYFCDYNGILKIHDDSSFNVNFDFTSPILDISRFPSPVSQNSSIPETIYIIIPDNFNGSDLSAAATTAAMINRLNEKQIVFKLVRESDRFGLPEKSSAIIIGTPARNAFLRDFLYKPGTGSYIGMPSTLGSGNRIYIPSASRYLADDEGLIQLMQSTRNPRYTYMVVTGNTDASVERAAMGLASPPLGPVGAGFIISADYKMPSFELNDVVSLKTLGFTSTTYYGYGTNSYSVNFYIPRNWMMKEGTSFILRYRNSDNLDETNSSLAVYLNDQPAGSIKIDVKAPGEKEVVIPINKKDIRTGWLNTLRIEATTDMIRTCVYNPRAFLVNIQDTSMLTLPHSLITDPKELSPITQPIYYFGSKPSVFVSMPEKPTSDDLSALMSFSSLLGALGMPANVYHVKLGNEADVNAVTGENILVIGRPSTNPNVIKVNEKLPQGFVNNSDSLKQKVGNTIYQIPPGVSLGILEAITSPSDPESGLTLISGTTEEGQGFVYKRLARSPINIYELEGNLVFVGNKTTNAFQTGEGSLISLDMASSNVTGTKVALEVVPTGVPSQATAEVQIVKYVSTVSVENPVSQMIGQYLLIGLLVAGAIVLIISLTRVARGGRRS